MFFILRQPYPFETNLVKSLRASLLLGVFVTAFLIIFQPFQLSLWETTHKAWKIAGYGVVTTTVYLLFFLGVRIFWTEERLEKSWTVGKEIIFSTAILAGIALGNTIYSAWLGIVSISTQVFMGFIPVVFCVGFFPISARVIIYHQWYKEKNSKGAKDLESEMKIFNEEEKNSDGIAAVQVTLVAENEKDFLSILPDQILYIESLDNYAKIVFVSEDGEIRQTILRGALKRFENQISQPYIRRCHRGYIANLHRVSRVTGNAQGYKLIFSEEKLEIPVSRGYGEEILSFINHKKH